MTTDEVIQAAKEAGFGITHAEAAAILFTRFAAMVAAAEREVCAQAAWDIVQYEVHADLADQVAAAIRARSTP